MSDLIDRGVAKQYIRTALHADMDLLSAEFASGMCNVLDSVPTVDAVPVKHGEWIFGKDDKTGERDLYAWTCSECGEKYPWQPNYCPNCGAKMDGGDADGRP